MEFLKFGVELVEDGAKRERQGIVVGEQRGPVRPKDPKIELGREAQFNRKLLEVERISHYCVLTQEALDRLQRPTIEDGQRVSALRFGDPRVMPLFQALCAFTHQPRGFRNHDLPPPSKRCSVARTPPRR